MNRPDKLLSNICILLLSSIVSFAILEASTEFYLVHFASDEVFRKFASLNQLKTRTYFHHVPHRYLGFAPTPNFVEGKNRHNSRGFRGPEVAIPKPNGVFRIACLGGSTTYGSQEDWHAAYPARLEAELKQRGWSNIEVINAGVNSHSSWGTMIRFELQVLDYEPDLIVLYDGINDIAPRLVWPSDLYRGDNSGYLAPASLRFMPIIFEYSTICRILMIKAGWTMPHNALHSIEEYPASAKFMEFLRQVAEGRYPQGVFTETSAMRMLEVNTPKYFMRNEENIAAIAQHRGIKVVFCSFKSSDQFPDQPEVSRPEYRKAIVEQNAVMRDLSERMSVGFIDLAADYPNDRKYFIDGRHMTEEGEALRARLIADRLEAFGLLPKRNAA